MTVRREKVQSKLGTVMLALIGRLLHGFSAANVLNAMRTHDCIESAAVGCCVE